MKENQTSKPTTDDILNFYIDNKQLKQRKLQYPTFSVSRAFRNTQDLRNWIKHPDQDRTNNGFLYVQTERKIE